MSAARALTATVLGFISGLHAAWGMGSSFPFADTEELAEAVTGSAVLPPPAACFAVAGGLACAAALTAGTPRRRPRVQRTATTLLAGAFAGRAVLGFAGRTDLIAPGANESERFRRLDRTLYSPLCAALAAGAALSRR